MIIKQVSLDTQTESSSKTISKSKTSRRQITWFPIIALNLMYKHFREVRLTECVTEWTLLKQGSQTNVHDRTLAATVSLVILRVEQSEKSVNASCGEYPGSVLFDPDQRYFSGNVEYLQWTASNRLNSNTELNGIDETHGKIIVEAGGVSVSKRIFDRQAHTHHLTHLLSALEHLSNTADFIFKSECKKVLKQEFGKLESRSSFKKYLSNDKFIPWKSFHRSSATMWKIEKLVVENTNWKRWTLEKLHKNSQGDDLFSTKTKIKGDFHFH